jgi:hypothetical protein
MAKHKKKAPEDMTVEELHAAASERDIPGRSSMNRDELLAALAEPDKPADAEETPLAPPDHPPVAPEFGAGIITPAAPPEPAPTAAHPALKGADRQPVPGAPGGPGTVPPPTSITGKGFFEGGEHPVPAKPVAAPGMKRARVTVPGAGVGVIDCEYPAGAPDPRAAAIRAAKDARGIVDFGAVPEVEFLD